MAYWRLEIGSPLMDNSTHIHAPLHNLFLITLMSCNQRKSAILCIAWQLNKVPNLHPSQQVRALADWRKTEALAVTSSEVRHWSSTRSIPTSTGRALSLCGVVQRVRLVWYLLQQLSRPLGLSHCRRYQRAGTTLAVIHSGRLGGAGKVTQFCVCVKLLKSCKYLIEMQVAVKLDLYCAIEQCKGKWFRHEENAKAEKCLETKVHRKHALCMRQWTWFLTTKFL